VHPFGTENACVFFADNTFLEPLAVGQRETAEAASLAGNQFTARDGAFRFRRGQEGFSAIVVGSINGDADQAQFVNAGVSGGNILDFGRDFEMPDGTKARMDFRLVCTADLRSPDFFGFTCERINVPKADRSKLIVHGNGVVAMRTVVITENNPTDFQYLFQELCNEREVDAHSFGMDIKCSNATISVLTPVGFEAMFGKSAASTERGLLGQAVIFATQNLSALKSHLKQNAIAFSEHMGRVIVDKAPGQGAHFIFEAA
jgi:hypothetical protein